MIKCSSCGKEIDAVPSWLNEVDVKVVCNNCPNRDLKSITEIKLEAPEAKPMEAEATTESDEE